MYRKPHRTARSVALLGALVTMSVGAWGAHAPALEEVVAHGWRPNIAAERIRFEATMDAYADRVGAALRSEMRKHITEQARPRLRIAQVGSSYRG